MLMMWLHKVFGIGLPEQDSSVFASELIIPRVKEHHNVFRQFTSDGD